MRPQFTDPEAPFDAIDPGTNYYGYARFEARRLVECGYATTCDVPSWRRSSPLVIEGQIARTGSRARPQNVIDLAFCAGWIRGQYRGDVIKIEDPQMWKGTIDGAVMLERIKGKLDEREHKLLLLELAGWPRSKHEHVIDAVGIGLWILRRIGV